MKNTFKKLLITALAAITAFSAAACGKGDNTGDIKKDPPVGDTFISYEDLADCTHIYNVKSGANDLVKDGKTDYTVVYPVDMANEKDTVTAITEFKNLFEEATGINVNIKHDLEYTSGTKIISMGATVQAKAQSSVTSLMAKYELGKDGFVIKSVGDSIYMLGNTAKANLYSVYEFFTRQFGFEAYTTTAYKINKDVKNAKLIDCEIVDIPDFEARTAGTALATGDRLRTIVYVDGFNNADGNTFVHNYYNLVPPEVYQAEHPKWFYGTGHTGQLCLEAQGDEEERIALKNAVVEAMKSRLLAQPDVDWIAFSHNDGGRWCTCNACTKDASLYDKGENTAAFASVIRFVNLVAADIKAWNESDCPDRDIKIFIYDYGKVSYAPVKLDENLNPVKDKDGKYTPYSSDLVLADNVAVYWCGFGAYGVMEGLVDASSNDSQIEKLERCQAVMSDPTMYIWTYSTCFQDYFLPVDSVSSRQNRYQTFKKYGAVGVFDQAQYDCSNSSDFGSLKGYVYSKLLWNCQLNVEELIRGFFKGYYGVAGDKMYDMYKEYVAYINYLVEKRNYSASRTALTAENFPYGVVKHFEALIEDAIDSIVSLEVADPQTYTTIKDRIITDTLNWYYLDIKIHPGYYTVDTLIEKQNAFLNEALRLGFTHCSENGAISSMFG